MLATFVQLEPALLAQLEDEPDLIEDLFAPSPGGLFDGEVMRAAILERGPQLLAGAIDMHPELRELIEDRVGVSQEALRQGSGGERSSKLMGEHSGTASAGPRTAGARSRWTRRGTASTTS